MTMVSISRLFLLTLAAASAAGGAVLGQSVGVTSATSGGPRGKPLAEVERVLRVGVDVKSNELITTGANDRAHLVFLDGTALTVGPQARLTIDRFVYDPNSRLGELTISASQGVFRLVGGKISKTAPVTVVTPASTLTIRGGILIFRVEPTFTTSTFVFGFEMTVAGQGKTQIVKAPGWQVTTLAGKPPAPPTQLAPGGLSAEMGQLEGGKGQTGSADADKILKESGFADRNSGKGPDDGQFGIPTHPDGDVTRALNNAVQQQQQQQKQFKPKYP